MLKTLKLLSFLISLLLLPTCLIQAQSKKKIYYANPYEAIDFYAYKTPSSQSKDIKKLAEYLVVPAQNDMEKVRAIYTWVATHINYDEKFKKNGEECSAINTLLKKRSVCEGYARLFNELCIAAGLNAEYIVGYSRQFSYKKRRVGKDELHAWNAVLIDGEWKLFDVTWASGGKSAFKQKNKMYSKFDEFWFATDPYFFLLYHLPNDDRWQLIPNKLNEKEFKSIPPVRASFNRLKFSCSDLISYYQNDKKYQPPIAYDAPFPITQINCPDTRVLNRDSVYTFTFKCDFASEFVIHDGRNQQVFQKTDNTFTVTFSPTNLFVYIHAVMLDEPSKAYMVCAYDSGNSIIRLKGN